MLIVTQVLGSWSLLRENRIIYRKIRETGSPKYIYVIIIFEGKVIVLEINKTYVKRKVQQWSLFLRIS